MLKICSFVILLFTASTSLAQIPDSLLKPSPVKTITNREYDALLKGEDQYHMSLVADLNGYPSAQKALRYKKELSLSAAQVAELTKINIELNRKKIEMGGFIVTNETKLDNLFNSKKINDGEILFYGNRSGLYYGELRNAILMAAFKTYHLLSAQQVNKLKGYKNDN